MTRKSPAITKSQRNSHLFLLAIWPLLALADCSLLNVQETDAQETNAEKTQNAQSIQTRIDEQQAMTWIRQLQSTSLAARNNAERELIALGPALTAWLKKQHPALPYASETEFRMRRVRKRIFENSVTNWGLPASLVVDDDWTNETLVLAVQNQTGNKLIISNSEFRTSAFTNTVHPKNFWDLIDTLCTLYDLAIDYSSEELQTVVLVPVSEQPNPAEITANTGLLRTEWIGNLQSDGPIQVQMRLAWEPRLKLVAIRQMRYY